MDGRVAGRFVVLRKPKTEPLGLELIFDPSTLPNGVLITRVEGTSDSCPYCLATTFRRVIYLPTFLPPPRLSPTLLLGFVCCVSCFTDPGRHTACCSSRRCCRIWPNSGRRYHPGDQRRIYDGCRAYQRDDCSSAVQRGPRTTGGQRGGDNKGLCKIPRLALSATESSLATVFLAR